MKLSTNNFLSQIKNLVTGGGRHSDDSPYIDSGFLRDIPVPLGALDLNTDINYDGSEGGAAVATLSGAYLAADETNARVVKVDDATDSIGHLTFPVPRDYDEETDVLIVRVLASQLTQSTDDDVELDSEIYVKTAGSALGADLDITAPGTVLSTTEQWIEFEVIGEGLDRDDVVNFELITNGANDTDGEEVLIHAVEISYRSTLVSYDRQDASGNDLR
jgi:hypothetical protein